MNQRQLELLDKRNRQAQAAWDRALDPARRSLHNPARVPYPEAVKVALAAYDEVIAHYRPQIWAD